jgi:arylsulfatase A-like enzyme
MITASKKTPRARAAVRRLSPLDVLVLSAWCGLAGGELEVMLKILLRNISSTNRLYQMTRHFVWVVPLTNLLLFLGLGVFLGLATKVWPRRAGWMSPRLVCALAVVPIFMVAGPRIYVEAWFILALGVATCLAQAVERHAVAMRRWLKLSFPVLVAIVLVQAGVIAGHGQLKQWREEARPLPPAGSPNVLLVVLDTVRADHLSLYGYERATSPTLERLAKRAIRFDHARAAAPWTLASHATMFTGRWPHELASRWLHPLRDDVLTLAEYLGSRGYATAGFVGNTFYCSYDSGLARGFTRYQDYVLGIMSAARTVALVDYVLKSLAQITPALTRSFPGGLSVLPRSLSLQQLSHDDRKDASIINREFLGWLQERPRRRPFFAFLNYVDAHSPYVLPRDARYRFGFAPRTRADFLFLLEDWFRVDKAKINEQWRALARDSYDNCLAYLDERLGEMFEELERRRVLEQTIVIITADHGEGLGEHDLYDHGESLYRSEIRVPLLIVLPSSDRPRFVAESVSLRDIPATTARLVSPAAPAPFPGQSLTRLWREEAGAPAPPHGADPVLSELSAPNPGDPNQGRSPARRGPLRSLAEGGFVYIRNEGDGREELFDERDDPRELLDRARVDSMRPILSRLRGRLDQLLKADSPPRAQGKCNTALHTEVGRGHSSRQAQTAINEK